MSEQVKDKRAFQDLSRDEQIEHMAKRVEQAKKMFPDQDWKSDTQWWVPVVDYNQAVKVGPALNHRRCTYMLTIERRWMTRHERN